ncbi:hypothetical protein [Nocardia brasiliensis]
MPDLKPFAELVPVDSGLCVAVTLRADGTPQATVVAAAGVAQDWDAYDQVMRDKRGTLVFVTPHRIYTNAATP